MRDGSTLLGTQGFATVPMGALGYTPDIEIASDESWQLVATDGAGAWRRDGHTGLWTQCFRRDNTSAALFDLDPTFGESDGAYSAKIAPSDPTVAYASWRHRIVKTTDSGANWSLCTTVPEMRMNSNAQVDNSYIRLCFGKMAIDPTNASVVYWAPQEEGLLRTTDGMASYGKIASVPDAVSPYSRAQNDDLYCLIAIDETSALVDTGTATERHSIVVVASIGNGVYRSTDGGDTFTQISSTFLYPANLQFIAGELWLFDYITTGNVIISGTNIYKYTGGSWSAAFGISDRGARFVAVDPTDSTIIYEGRWFRRSNDGGATWADIVDNSNNVTWVGNTAPAIANVKESNGDFVGSRFTVHASSGKLFWASGVGIWYMDLANYRAADKTIPVKLVINEDTAGIENIVPQYCRYTSAGTLIMSAQDRAVWKAPADRSQFPEGCYPPNTLTNGYGIDYAAQDPNYIAAQITKNGIYQAYSADGGDTWQQFPVTGTTTAGGGVCVVDVDKVIIAPGSNGWPVVTHDGGNTWADCNFSGFAKRVGPDESGWGFTNTPAQRHIICNDKDNPLNVYAYNYGPSGVADVEGIWKSTDGGLNFTRTTTVVPFSVLRSYHNYLRYQDGILWLNQHYTTPYNGDNGNRLFRSVDEGSTFEEVPDLTSCYFYDFGKAAPSQVGGGSYPALYAEGYVGGVKATWRCDNADAATIADMAWTLVKQSEAFARPTAFAADPTTFGRVCVGRGGTSFEEAFYDYTMRLS